MTIWRVRVRVMWVTIWYLTMNYRGSQFVVGAVTEGNLCTGPGKGVRDLNKIHRQYHPRGHCAKIPPEWVSKVAR